MYSRFYVVFAVAALLSSLLYPLCPFSAAAQTCGQDCTTPPTCSQLGYKKDIYCPDGFITCPFDTSYKWCKEYTCEDGRYYSSPLTGDYTCSKAEYHGLTCYDCVAAVEEDICSAYDEQTLVEALQCDDCPVITVLNDIAITDKLPDLKEGRTLKAADGQTYTISINPNGDIQISDPEITFNGETGKLSQLLGTELGIILTTAAGSRIDNIHFDVAATHNVDVAVLTLGDTTFNNLSIVIDGKDEEIERMGSFGVFLLNSGGKIAFEGDTYIEMKNIKGRQTTVGVYDLTIAAVPETAASVTADNFNIIQENINGVGLVGLALKLLNITDDVTITQNENIMSSEIDGIWFGENATINGNQPINITQLNNDTYDLYGITTRALTIEYPDMPVSITQIDNTYNQNMSAIDYDDSMRFTNVTVVQENNTRK